MTEEIRTTRAVVDVGFGGSEADFIASLGQIDAKLAQTIQGLERFRRQNGTVAQGLLAVDDATGKLAHSFDNMAAQAKAAFGSDALKGYVASVSQATMAFNAGALAPAEYAATMKRLEMQLPGLASQFKISTQELGRFVLGFNEARAAAEQEARAQGLVGMALEKGIQKRTEARIVQERETEATKRQTAAVAQLEAAENNRRYAQQNRLQVQGVAPRGAALTQTETQEERGAAIELGLQARAAEAEAYAASLNKLSVASRALQAEAQRLQAQEDQLNKIFALGDLSASAYRNSLSQVIASKRELAAQYNGEAAERARVIRLEAEETQTLQRLRQAYGEVETASQRLQVELRELNAQFILGNVGLREFLALRARATAAATPVGPVPGFNASQLGERPLSSNVSAYNAETQRLASAYDLAGEAARRFATDQTLLNERLAAGRLTTQQHATMMSNLATQQKAVEESGKGLGNTYQRQQILQAGLVNTFQSLAAGQGVMSTLFIQSTQLVGAFGQVNLAMLGIATAGLVVTAAIAGVVASIARVGDVAVLAEARIEALTGSANQARSAYDSLRAIGMSTGVSANAAAGPFAQLLIGADQLSATNEQVLRLTQMFQQLGTIGGGSVQQISAGMQQFVQAMGKGKLDGDELKSIMENLPLLARSLATSLGVSVGSLREMGEQGRLTSQVVFAGLLSQADAVNRQFGDIPMTMARGWNVLQNSIEGSLVDLNRFAQVSQTLGGWFASAAREVMRLRSALGGGSPQENNETMTQERDRLRAQVNAYDSANPRGPLNTPNMDIPNNNAGGLQLPQRAETPNWTPLTLAAVRASNERNAAAARLAELERLLASSGSSASVVRVNDAITGGLRLAEQPTVQAYAESDAALTALRNTGLQRRLNPRQNIEEEFQRVQTQARTVLAIEPDRMRDAQRAMRESPEGSDERKTATESFTRSLNAQREATTALAESESMRADALARLDAAGAAAARREENRVEALQRAVSRASENVNEVGASRSVRAFGELSEKLQAVYMDQNEAARAGGLLRQAQDALAASTQRASQEYAESNRSISLTTQSLEDKNNISRLEALGTRAALEEIDGITRTRELERAAIEETNATRTVSASIRALEVQLAEQEREGNTAATVALQERLNVEKQQLTTVQSLYEARRAAINDPANGRLGQELAQQQRQAIDYATKLSADYMYDVFTGKISQIGAKLKETLLRAIADGIANQVIRPIIAPIIAGAVNMVSGPSGLLSGVPGAGAGLGSLWGGISSGGQQAAVASTAGSTSGAVNQAGQSGALMSAGRYGNLGAAFTGNGLANTGIGFVDGALNSYLVAPSMLTQTGYVGAGGVPIMTGTPGLTTAGGIGGAAGVLGGAYSIYSGAQRGGLGGAVGMAGGAAGIAGGIGMLGASGALGGTAAGLFGAAGALSFVPVYGWIAAAILAVVASLLPGEKASGKGQMAWENIDDGSMGTAGLTGDRFSAANLDMSKGAAGQIADLARNIGGALGGASFGSHVAVGTTSSRGEGAGKLYLDVAGQKAEFNNDEAGAKALAEQAATFVLRHYRENNRASGDYKGILEASGDSVETLTANLEWYKSVYQAFQDTGEAASAFQKSLDSVRDSYQPTIDKANELRLSTDKLTQARDKELAAVQKQRDDQLLEIREQLSLRETLVAGGTGYQQIADMFQRVNWRQAEAELESLKNTLKDLGLSTAETAVEVERLRALQGAEFWKNFATQMEALDHSVIGRILRATGRTDEADLKDFEFNAKAEILNLTQELAKLGLSADIAAKKIAETEQAIGAERLALQQRIADAAAEIAKAEAQKLADIAAAAWQAILDAGKSVRAWLDSQKTNTGAGGVSSKAALLEAQDQFGRDLGLARGGDQDALARITGTADRLLAAAQKQYASGVDFQAIRGFVLNSMENLPVTKSYDEQILAALKALGGSVNVEVSIAVIRTISETLNALPQDKLDKLVQAQTVFRDIQETVGRFLTPAEFAGLVEPATVDRLVNQFMGRDITAAERDGLVYTGTVVREIEQKMGRNLTDEEKSYIFTSGRISRLIDQTVGNASGAALIAAGRVTRTVDQTVVTQESITVSRSIDEKLGRVLDLLYGSSVENVRILGQINQDTNNLWKAAAGVNQPGLRVNSSQWSHDNGSNIVKFAKGGIFESATGFGFGRGKLGVMGEAGPEAIVPLERDSSGKLGLVQHQQTMDLSGLVKEIAELKNEVKELRKQQAQEAESLLKETARGADASEETSESNAKMVKTEGLVGRRARVA